ncbi:hypothetical protein Ec53638_0436 [Escherichia coli 53638]|nr:hypothetical protein Ec53638_0436 [Escherichia coli 53638]
MISKSTFCLHLFAQGFCQIDIKADNLIISTYRFKGWIGAETPKLIFSAAEAPKVKEASKAARTNFFMMELPSVNLMIFGRVCGMG